MQPDEVEAQLSRGESQTTEFKTSLNEDKEAIETLCAFANAEGGTVLIGVTDAGILAGCNIGKRSIEDLANKIRRNTDAPLYPLIEIVDLHSKEVIAATIGRRQAGQVFFAFGRALARVGKTNQVMTPEEIRSRLAERPVSPEQDTPSPLDGYLPPEESVAVQFVGRERELDALRQWLRSPAMRRWALMGDGGKGKTAIAYKFASEIKQLAPEPFQFVIWLSAKRRRFVEGALEAVPDPDFTDLDSALNWILLHYGWGDEAGSIEDRKGICLELLNEYPALIVADDIDSLEGTQEAAIEFVTLEIPTTKSKVLLTSRRSLMGLGATTTVVDGFKGEDGIHFVRSRLHLMGLDQAAFPNSTVQDIIKETDGSPLFIEALLGLCLVGVPAGEAVRAWKSHGAADEARRYALEREFNLLTAPAKEVLAACCVTDRPLSFAEIQAVTGSSNETLQLAIGELQRLFLVPKPKLIEDVERFDLNVNTRTLVRAVLSDTDILRRTQAAFNELTGDITASPSRRAKVGAYITQAVGLVKQDRHADAERTLQAGLTEFPNDRNLIAQLAWVYKVWRPLPRVADAREQFGRASQLNCPNQDLYWHWWQMETDLQEWTKAAEAAEVGHVHLPLSSSLLFAAGYARGRLARDLYRELQPRSLQEAIRARNYLQKALKDTDTLTGYQERTVQARTLRALALTLELLVDLEEEPRRRTLAREGQAVLQRWQAEHPDDTYAASESWRLAPKFLRLASAGP